MKKLTDHLQRSLWIYLLIAVVVIAFWVTVFDILASPADNEQVSILFIGPELDSAALEEELTAKIESLTEQPIRQINVDVVNTRDHSVIAQLLATRGNDTDLIILPGEMLKDGSWGSYFPELPREKLDPLLAEPSYYYEEEVPYGILLGSGEGDSRFGAFYPGDDACYVFFGSRSVNLGGLFSVGAETDDAALAIVKYLLE